jgi:hypothetical protein
VASGLTNLLAELAAAGAEFVVVGGLAAVAQGAPLTTLDLDIVHRRTPENVDRLVALLERYHARYRGRPGGLPLPIDKRALLGTGHSLFMTDLGPLDLLGAIEEGLDYDQLLGRSRRADIASHAVHVLDLAEIVRLKRESTHPKDQAMLPVLEETLRRRGVKDQPPPTS